jgi:hypothetical protein
MEPPSQPMVNEMNGREAKFLRKGAWVYGKHVLLFCRFCANPLPLLSSPAEAEAPPSPAHQTVLASPHRRPWTAVRVRVSVVVLMFAPMSKCLTSVLCFWSRWTLLEDVVLADDGGSPTAKQRGIYSEQLGPSTYQTRMDASSGPVILGADSKVQRVPAVRSFKVSGLSQFKRKTAAEEAAAAAAAASAAAAPEVQSPIEFPLNFFKIRNNLHNMAYSPIQTPGFACNHTEPGVGAQSLCSI